MHLAFQARVAWGKSFQVQGCVLGGSRGWAGTPWGQQHPTALVLLMAGGLPVLIPGGASLGTTSPQARNQVKLCPVCVPQGREPDPRELWGLLPGGNSLRSCWERPEYRLGSSRATNSLCERPGLQHHPNRQVNAGSALCMARAQDKRGRKTTNSLNVTLTCRASVFSSVQRAHWAKCALRMHRL